MDSVLYPVRSGSPDVMLRSRSTPSCRAVPQVTGSLSSTVSRRYPIHCIILLTCVVLFQRSQCNLCVQAAAHGVPTVATKNGGPVDIMKTLHHGVTVDPTNGRELGNALLEILTHPATWQEMSRNGGPSTRAICTAPAAWVQQ